MSGKIAARLAELGITLPQAVVPQANYVPWVQSGALIFTAGQLPMADGTLRYAGKLGAGTSIEDGYAAARLAAINVLAVLSAALNGDLDRVVRFVKVTGFVNATPDFLDHPKIVNGGSDLFVEIFGDAGKHARSAVGMGSLPFGAAAEIEVVVEVR